LRRNHQPLAFPTNSLLLLVLVVVVLQCDTLQAAASHMGVDTAVLEQELGSYAAAAGGQQQDAWGKRYFPTQVSPAGPFWVAQVTPVVHYCMGGLRIDAEARVSGAGATALLG
jgi:succinate dehydrogenase/fumarate reductase flavoprotein subunit